MASFAQVEPMPRYPILLAVLSAALFGAATPASKWLLTGLSPFQLAGLLYLGAAAGVAPAAMCQKGGVGLLLRTDHHNRARLLGAVVFGGIFGPIALLFALRLADAASVSLWLNLELADRADGAIRKFLHKIFVRIGTYDKETTARGKAVKTFQSSIL